MKKEIFVIFENSNYNFSYLASSGFNSSDLIKSHLNQNHYVDNKKVIAKCIECIVKLNNHKIKNQLFTENELSFIVDSLNETFNNAVRKLETKTLGDLERGFIEKTRDKAKELIMQITA